MCKPLRKCKDCGLEAFTEEDLSLFRTDNTMKYNRANLCKVCNYKRPYNRNEENRLNHYYKKTYGMSLQNVKDTINQQNNKCKICGKEEGASRMEKFVVDHCHTKGNVRGIICGKCNTALGLVNDDTTILQNMISYLKG